jgi:CHAT domain-containing protein
VVGGGDELAGLARAFLYAGAGGLIVSQWRVDDATTTALMARLYRGLRDGATPPTALRAAQIAGLFGEMGENGGLHPFFWAGFQFIGASGATEEPPVTQRSRSS